MHVALQQVEQAPLRSNAITIWVGRRQLPVSIPSATSGSIWICIRRLWIQNTRESALTVGKVALAGCALNYENHDPNEDQYELANQSRGHP
jgi:hypothetical protein